ncbi:DEAD/DEAH box helicase [Marinicella litoralis]|uniref:ATP-dependent RNA helicase DeaD n=1 Tax=Marinicella litoralis TaxID=644220 RepID=A0A4R6XSF5_9GAMM|nr:DEAD/DEAH box helicase [Marinicella litoralis]TDR22696.1 ATP-dependent RNA helicase CsdA [Marinicella litoralis]
MSQSSKTLSFDDLALSPEILKSVKENGYEQPSPIQEASIPPILAGKDVLGQAQTGTGKTAAFALPILSNLDMKAKHVQVLVLTPTRELAIQVAEAFQSYARHIEGFHVLPIYGGQSYDIQLKQLKRGVQVVVGTPGRVMDHMRRKTLKLEALSTLVLDEADEMLRMGFIDDVDWILSHTPKDRQIALFSATMPKEVKKVAVNHLHNPVDIKIETKTSTATNIRQRYWMVSGLKKLEALTRVLEVEDFDGVLIFVRTKMATEELAEKLQARGFSAEALNGDMVQKQRERLVAKLKNGSIDILIGTDVVARGLDVERISHVINYDIPYDTESYVHRIGRTGRAGRSGDAILFISRREQRMLRMIEKATNSPIEPMNIPTVSDINDNRMLRFKNQINETLAAKDLSIYQQLVDEFENETDFDPKLIAAALAYMIHGDKGMLLVETKGEKHERNKPIKSNEFDRDSDSGRSHSRQQRSASNEFIDPTPIPLNDHPDIVMERFQVSVGREQGVKPSNIVGMICNEAELEREYIGQIDIYDQVATVDLPADMPKEIMDILWNGRLCGRKSEIQKVGGGAKGKSRKNSDDYQPSKPKRVNRRNAKAGSATKSKGKAKSFGKAKRKPKK